MTVISPASSQELLQLLIMLAILLAAARLLGELATRLGQPPVMGEILAGVVLGPSMLSGWLAPVATVILPQTAITGHLVELIGLLGAMLLLVITGIETDLPLIRRNLHTATKLAVGGLLVPFTGGLLIAWFLPEDLLGEVGTRAIFALFLATALAVSAIPVVAKVLLDLGLIRRRFGQTVLAAGMIDDTVAWVMLSIVLVLSGETGGSPAELLVAAGRIVVFLLVAATLGRWVVNAALAFVQDRLKTPDRILTLVVVTMFAFGAVAQALHVEAVLGAFVAGIIFGQSPRLSADVVRRLHSVTLAVFAPIFFAIAGLKVQVAQLIDSRLLLWTALVLATAIAGKMLGVYLGARVAGVDHYTSLAYGSALNARGAVEIIIASIGLAIGILSPAVYSMIVLIAVLTSLMTPPLVRAFLKRAPANLDDDASLARAEAEQSGFSPPRRVLIPVRPRGGVAEVHALEAGLLEKAAPKAAITLLSVASKDERKVAESLLEALAAVFAGKPVTKVMIDSDPIAAILKSATNGHDLIVLGAPERMDSEEVLFNPVVDAVARLAPCPTLIVTGHHASSHFPPRRIIIPTNGSWASRQAAQLAFGLADDHTEVLVLHVFHKTPYARLDAPEAAIDRGIRNADDIVEDLVGLAAAYGIKARSAVRTAAAVDDLIVLAATEFGADLVVLGTDLRPGSSRLHLGPQVESVIRRTPCPVLILNSP